MKRKVFVVALSAVGIMTCFVLMGMLGIRTFTKKVYNGRDCEWGNIDHLELRARVDVPAINHCDCQYSAKEKKKISVFRLQRQEDGLAEYIRRNNLQLLDSTEALPEFNTDTLDHSTDSLYFRKGSEKDHDYVILLNKEKATLGIRIDYKN